MRICAEMSGIEECKAQGLWCDGILPDEYHLSESRCHVTGRTWICFGEQQNLWEFRLELPKGTRNLDSLDWSILLPSSEETKWLSVDFEECKIDLDPGAAIQVAP